MTKSNIKAVFSMWTRVDLYVSHCSVTNIKSSYGVEKWNKRRFLRFKIFFMISNLLWQWRATWRKLNLSRTCLNSSESQKSCDFLAKINFVRATFRKFGAVCDRVRKSTEASINYCVIYLKSKQSRDYCKYNESWLNNKTEKVWLLFVCPFILLLLLIMLYTIVFVCRHHVDPNWFPYLLRTLSIINYIQIIPKLSPIYKDSVFNENNISLNSSLYLLSTPVQNILIKPIWNRHIVKSALSR